MTIGLRIDPEEQTADPGTPAVFTIHVVNQSGIVDRVALDILGTAAAWSKTDPPAVALFPGADGTAVLTVTSPLGTPLGPVPLGVRATAETSGFVEVGEATLNVGASRSVEAELRPRTATGKRRATSVVYLHNLGNAPTKVQVVASDPDEAIIFDAPSAVQIGPGMTADVPLRMRLPTRDKQGGILPYKVLVEGGETGQVLDGQVRQPAKKRWPVMALMVLAALLVAAFIFLRPKDSVAIKEGKADEAPTTVTTAAPAAAEQSAATTAAPTTQAAGGGAGGAAGAAGASGAAPGAPGAAAAGPGGAAGPAVVAVTTTAVKFDFRPTTTTRAGLSCPAKGTPQNTAQRVVCAWELRRLAEASDSTIPDVVNALNRLSPIGGQRVTTTTVDSSGNSVVAFDKTATCPAGRGVRSVTIGGTSAGVNAGRAIAVAPC